jgi:hypothetical protein
MQYFRTISKLFNLPRTLLSFEAKLWKNLLGALNPTLKVGVPNFITCLNRTPLFEQYMVRYMAPRMDTKNMCSKEVGLNV